MKSDVRVRLSGDEYLGKEALLSARFQAALWLWGRIGMTLRFPYVLAQGEISGIAIDMCMKRTACVRRRARPALRYRSDRPHLPVSCRAARSHEFHQSSHPPTDSIFACSAPVGATATIYRGELVGPASGWVAHPALNNTAIGVEMSQDEVGRDQMPPPAAAGEAE